MTTNWWKWKNQVFKRVDFDLQLLKTNFKQWNTNSMAIQMCKFSIKAPRLEGNHLIKSTLYKPCLKCLWKMCIKTLVSCDLFQGEIVKLWLNRWFFLYDMEIGLQLVYRYPQDPQLIPESVDRTEPYLYMFFFLYIHTLSLKGSTLWFIFGISKLPASPL